MLKKLTEQTEVDAASKRGGLHVLNSELDGAIERTHRLNQALRRGYSLLGWGLGVFVILALLVVYFAVRIEIRSIKNELLLSSRQIQKNEAIIQEQNQTIEQLRLLGGNAKLGGCKNYETEKLYPCVQVYGGTRANGEYAMLYDESEVRKENLR